MVDEQIAERYRRLLAEHRRVVGELIPVLEAVALASIRDAIPGARRLEVRGEYTEDMVPTLRIQRVLDADGAVLFEIGSGHPDPAVEDAVDETGVEYLDLLLDLTGDDYLGVREIEG
jgi:hypothetical protein